MRRIVEGILGICKPGFGNGLTAHADPRRDDGLGIARDQGMPGGQTLALVKASVRAAGRHPCKISHVLRSELNAVRDISFAVTVAGATAGVAIQEPTGGQRRHHFPRLLILKPYQATSPAPVAKALPFLGRHLG